MSSLHYRQNIVASIRIAGHQIGDVVSHGGNHQVGSHITACFGTQLMITMLDLNGALQFARAWTAAEHQWVYDQLPTELPGAGTKDAASTGPGLTVRANGVDKINARYDSTSRTAHIRAGALTWIVQDRAAGDSMIAAWRYVARLAPRRPRPRAGPAAPLNTGVADPSRVGDTERPTPLCRVVHPPKAVHIPGRLLDCRPTATEPSGSAPGEPAKAHPKTGHRPCM